MNRKQQTMVDSFISTHHDFIRRIQQEINTMDKTHFKDYAAKYHDLIMENENRYHSEKPFDAEENENQRILFGGLTDYYGDIYHTIRKNVKALCAEYFRQFFEINHDYFRYDISSPSYHDIFFHLLPVKINGHDCVYELRDGSRNPKYPRWMTITMYVDEGDTYYQHHFCRFQVNFNDLKAPDYITIIPYGMICNARAELDEDNRKVIQLQKETEDKLKSIQRKYKGFDFGADWFTCYREEYRRYYSVERERMDW